MFSNVQQCSAMFNNAYQCSAMFSNVHYPKRTPATTITMFFLSFTIELLGTNKSVGYLLCPTEVWEHSSDPTHSTLESVGLECVCGSTVVCCCLPQLLRRYHSYQGQLATSHWYCLHLLLSSTLTPHLPHIDPTLTPH